MKRTRLGWIALGAMVAVPSACADRTETVPNGTSVATVRDSAGIRIVENAVTSWPPTEVWRIADSPELEIGVASGDPDYELFQVHGAIGSPDGGVLVAEFGARLRYYDADGRHLRTVSREGEGPGEAGAFAGLAPYRGGDSIVLVTEQSFGSSGPSRTLLLVLDWEEARGHRVEAWYPGGGAPTDSARVIGGDGDGVQDWLADGSIVVRGSSLLSYRGSEGDIIWTEAPLMLLTPGGELADTIATVRSVAYELRTVDNRRYELLLDGPDSPPARAHGQRVFWSHPDRWQVDVFEATPFDPSAFTSGPTGAMSHSFRVDAPLDSTTEAVREEYIQAMIALSAARGPGVTGGSEYRERLESLTSYPTVPTVQALEVDAEGNVWLEFHAGMSHRARSLYRTTGSSPETEPSRWVVFDEGGRLLGSVLTPIGVEVTEIGSDYLLGWRANELGVQHIVKYRILKDRG